MRQIAFVVLMTTLGSPALACLPQMLTPSSTPKVGEACAISWTLTDIHVVGLTEATVLPSGLIVQDIYDGNACYWEANLLVHDCAAGVAIVVGPDNRELMLEPRETGIDRIAAALESGVLTQLTALAGVAQAEGYPPALTVPSGSAIAVNGQTIDISCACATLFQGSGS